jgi:uncharacterized protein YlxP (DUF503 family)
VKIGLVQMEFLIPGARSLKDKRRVMKSVKERLRSRFNCSVAEVDLQEKWGRGRIAACVVAVESTHAHEQVNAIVRFAEGHHEAEMVHADIEIL